jgi:3-dehydroquinate synthase
VGVSLFKFLQLYYHKVDSSVGGKTAINNKYGKNLVGSFYQPQLVLSDTGILKTLPARELKAGYSEIVKYALLGDYRIFYLA